MPLTAGETVQDGADNDERAAIDLAGYVCCGGGPELEAFVEWLRQRVLCCCCPRSPVTGWPGFRNPVALL